ncbi:hypothetical protein [Marinilabilia salmonicolor]|uniref:hypothetical protein n=1 Tax=Marinilabilia salmonicolor TaxID=989 RepID=UPI00029A192D|nr:hypothetical protein [Marinilabilia salmonicolor]
MKKLTNLLFSSDSFIFFISLAVIHGVSFQVMDVLTVANNPDSVTYLGIAELDFNQSEIRRYRVIIPFLAGAINFVFGNLFDLLAPWTFEGDFSLSMSFLIVNNLLMALAGVFVFKYVYVHTGHFISSILGLVSFLTCRWTGVLAGTPLVDSLFVLVLVLVLLGLKTNNWQMLIFSIFLGPWAKESFIFIAPIIFFYAPIKKTRMFFLFLVSGILVFSGRFIIDALSDTPPLLSLGKDVRHLTYIVLGLKRLFSFHGIYEVFSVTGFWILLIVPAVLNGKLKSYLIAFKGYEWWFLVSVIFQALISVEISRMLFLLTPLLAVLWGKVIRGCLEQPQLNKLFRSV